MRFNDDGKTVRAMDVLFSGIGEMVGGAREERLDVLQKRMSEMGIEEKELDWYLDLRFGTAPHAGFGLGFERLVQFATECPTSVMCSLPRPPKTHPSKTFSSDKVFVFRM